MQVSAHFFFLIEKNKKLHTYIVFSLNLVYAIYFSGHIILPSHCFMNIFLVAVPPTSVSASGRSHDSLFLIRTNTRLRIIRAQSSTISVGAKESVSMFSRTIFYQLNNSSIQLWLHHDCYLLSKKKTTIDYKIWQALPVAQWTSRATCIQGGLMLHCNALTFVFFISICSFHIMQHEPPRQTYTDGILAAACQSNMCATHMDRCHFSSVLVINDN